MRLLGSAAALRDRLLTSEAHKLHARFVEPLGERIIIGERIGRAHRPPPGSVLLVRVEDAVLGMVQVSLTLRNYA
jgi:hypothetical protein